MFEIADSFFYPGLGVYVRIYADRGSHVYIYTNLLQILQTDQPRHILDDGYKYLCWARFCHIFLEIACVLCCGGGGWSCHTLLSCVKRQDPAGVFFAGLTRDFFPWQTTPVVLLVWSPLPSVSRRPASPIPSIFSSMQFKYFLRNIAIRTKYGVYPLGGMYVFSVPSWVLNYCKAPRN